MDNLQFNNGLTVPALGFCTYGIPASETVSAVQQALELGYRGIDTAQFNGNEAPTGAAVRQSAIPRAEVFVTSKVQTNGYAATKAGIDDSLKRSGLDYFDLLLLHWPMPDTLGSYRALEEAYQAGKTRSIGLSNFNISQTKNVMDSFATKPVVDEIETHLYLQQEKMHAFLEKNDIVHEAYGPFGEDVRAMISIPTVQNIAQKHHKTPAQIILKFLVQSKIMVNARSISPQHMQANLNIFDFELTADDMQALRALERHQPMIDWPTTMHIDE
ncbi:MAG TPA: aldo/keto reductase [Lactobacillus sp.]|nr:aldo/keto reductase [Lactobacillus sp.]